MKGMKLKKIFKHVYRYVLVYNFFPRNNAKVFRFNTSNEIKEKPFKLMKKNFYLFLLRRIHPLVAFEKEITLAK